MWRYHRVLRDRDSERIGLLCRLVNFAEDVVEDAECKDLLVSLDHPEEIAIEPVECRYSIRESTEIYGEHHRLENIVLGSGDKSFRELYNYIVEAYRTTLHSRFLNTIAKLRGWKTEYYLGILFDGTMFIAEGRKDHISLPGIPQCFSAHTHPEPYPLPSSTDLKMITRLLLDRGIGHAVVAMGSTLVIYRVKPLTLSDYEVLQGIDYRDPVNALREISRLDSIKLRYI